MDGITDSMDMNLSKLQKMVTDREAWHATVHEVAKSQIEQRRNNTTTLARIRLPAEIAFHNYFFVPE